MSGISVVILLKKKKFRRNEGESGSNEEDSELDSLLGKITEEWDEASVSYDDQLKQKLKKTEVVKKHRRECTTASYEGLCWN